MAPKQLMRLACDVSAACRDASRAAARLTTAASLRIAPSGAGDLAPDGYSSTARQPQSDLTAAVSKRPLFGGAHGCPPRGRPSCNVSFHDYDSVADQQQCNKDIESVDKVSFVAEEKDLQSDEEPIEKDAFMPEEKDLQSDEALWALYHRWCKHFKIERDHDEMVRRFDLFKYRAFLVHRGRNSDPSERLTLNKFADTKRRKPLFQAQLAKRATYRYHAERRVKIFEKIWEMEVGSTNHHQH
ncbi:hypothetical protein ACP70R_014869 [Stipagrostis hirtigluma subsp. patula]